MGMGTRYHHLTIVGGAHRHRTFAFRDSVVERCAEDAGGQEPPQDAVVALCLPHCRRGMCHVQLKGVGSQSMGWREDRAKGEETRAGFDGPS